MQPCPFTETEWIIVHLFANDLQGPEIAGLLYVSTRTVDTHCANLKAKLGVRTMTAAVRIATENRWI